MDRIWGANVSQRPPTIPESAPTGYPTDGSATGGISATVPQAFWYHMIASELMNAIIAGNVSPDRNNLSQLAESIRKQDQAIYDSLYPLIQSLQNRLQNLEQFPSGAIQYFARSTPPSASWIVCDGRSISRETYAELFAVIGETYGRGNGSTTFSVPNLVARVPWGATTNIGTFVPAGLPNITGEVAMARRGGAGQWYSNGALAYGSNFNVAIKHGNSDDWGSRIRLDASKSNSIYGSSETVQPPALKLLPCIHI